jgi:ABC-type spermidine/putrescine transport system permease subunit I
MFVVGAVVMAGRWVGPRAAGIVALLPVVLTSLILVLHPRAGGSATAAVLANSVPGMIGFTTGLVTLHVSAVPLGSAAALILALAVCVAWNAALLVFSLRSARHARP